MTALFKRAACVAWMATGTLHFANAQSFEPGGQHAVVLGMDSNQVYLAVAPDSESLHQSLRQRWEVHAAPRTGGEMVALRVQPKRAAAWLELRNIQHVAVHSQGHKAVIAAQQHGEDLDLFLSHRMDALGEHGDEIWTAPMPLDGLNTRADEAFPSWNGQDLTFASNRSGTFTVYDAPAALQLLSSAPRNDLPDGMEDVLSVVTVGPTFTWVSGRRSQDSALSVQRWDWPQPTFPVPEGWTLCVSMKGQNNVSGTLAVRAVDSGHVIRAFDLDAEGCATLAGLPADQAWSFQWKPAPEDGLPTPSNAVADLRGPDGQVVRRYILNASKGWSFVMLPLDAIQELSGQGRKDSSTWPNVTFTMLSYERGQASPTASSWLAFQAWSKAARVQFTHAETGHWAVVGHADATGTKHVNDKLSMERAQRIATYLMDEMAWPETAVKVRGAGSAEPIGEDPAQNRRVEVFWVPSMQ